MEKPAIHGGTPVREKMIYYGRQCIEEDDIRSVTATLQSDFLTCGPKVAALEKRLCEVTGARYASAVSNGTAALHCACIAAGIGPGDEVITSPMTFAASANCILYCGGTPVFADIDPKTYNISPESIRRCITPRTKAVIAVDYTGQAVAHREIAAICKEHGLLFIEDAAHAIGTLYDGKPVGSLADMTCFSFHPVKTVTSGEGGAVTTNSPSLAQKLVLAHMHGITHDPAEMSGDFGDQPWYYEQIALGYNYRITDIQSALLCTQLDKLPRFKARRRAIAAQYREAFADLPGIILQEEIPESDTCPHLFLLRLDETFPWSRTAFYHAMRAERVQCQVHYIPVYWFPYYQEKGYTRGLCPNAEKLYEQVLSIPLYPAMTERDVEDVIHAVRKLARWDGKICVSANQGDI